MAERCLALNHVQNPFKKPVMELRSCLNMYGFLFVIGSAPGNLTLNSHFQLTTWDINVRHIHNLAGWNNYLFKRYKHHPDHHNHVTYDFCLDSKDCQIIRLLHLIFVVLWIFYIIHTMLPTVFPAVVKWSDWEYERASCNYYAFGISLNFIGIISLINAYKSVSPDC